MMSALFLLAGFVLGVAVHRLIRLKAPASKSLPSTVDEAQDDSQAEGLPRLGSAYRSAPEGLEAPVQDVPVVAVQDVRVFGIHDWKVTLTNGKVYRGGLRAWRHYPSGHAVKKSFEIDELLRLLAVWKWQQQETEKPLQLDGM